jgi:hypothetical protein
MHSSQTFVERKKLPNSTIYSTRLSTPPTCDYRSCGDSGLSRSGILDSVDSRPALFCLAAVCIRSSSSVVGKLVTTGNSQSAVIYMSILTTPPYMHTHFYFEYTIGHNFGVSIRVQSIGFGM